MIDINSHQNQAEDNILIGNQTDKSSLKNPLSRGLVSNFDSCLLELAKQAAPKSIHEVGCGEGRVSRILHKQFGLPIRATDFSSQLISENLKKNDPDIHYLEKSIYDLSADEDSASLILCCEVLEHLEDPQAGLEALRSLNFDHLLLSVPREPIWRMLNCARGKYLPDLGNTPGHLNHWSSKSFIRWLTSNGLTIKTLRKPLPWTMVLASKK